MATNSCSSAIFLTTRRIVLVKLIQKKHAGELVIKEWKWSRSRSCSSRRASSCEVWGSASQQVLVEDFWTLQFYYWHFAILPRSRFSSTSYLWLFPQVISITRSEGGAGVTGSVLRGAGGEKENRGMRNMDGMVCSFRNSTSSPPEYKSDFRTWKSCHLSAILISILRFGRLTGWIKSC